MRISSYLLGFLASSFTALLTSGCGDAPATVSGGNNDISGDGDGQGGGGQCESETEQGCTCPDGKTQSRQYCYEGNWLDCNCDDTDGDGSFAAVSDCKPGRYEGEFFGMYNSAFSPTPIPVWALNVSGAPGLAFTLNAKGEASQSGDEFATELEISDGYVKGTADGLFPFEGKLTGKLRCKDKQFDAILDGGYALLTQGLGGVNEAKFKGPVLGKYDVKTKSFPCQKGNKKFPKCDLDAPVLATNVVSDIVGSSAFPKPDNPSYWNLTETDISLPIFPSSIPQGHGGMGYWWAVWVGEATAGVDAGAP